MRIAASAAGLALVMMAASAEAQPAPPAAPAPQTEEALQKARTHFAAGVNLLRDPAGPRYEEAYREFKTAYASSPAPQILGNLGLCAMMLERDSEAIDAYEKYLQASKDLAPAERQQIERDLQTLKVGEVHVTFTTNVPDTMIVDRRVPTQGEPITNVYGPVVPFTPIAIGIRQGHHIVTARAPDRPELTWEFDAQAGDAVLHAFELPEPAAPAPAPPPPAPLSEPLPPPPPAERPIPKAFWYSLGATGTLALASIVTGAAAVDTAASFKSANTGLDPDRASTLHSRTDTLNVTTDVLLVTAVVAAGVTTYIYLTRPAKDRTSALASFWKGSF